jgi:hypothetical protein
MIVIFSTEGVIIFNLFFDKQIPHFTQKKGKQIPRNNQIWASQQRAGYCSKSSVVSFLNYYVADHSHGVIRFHYRLHFALPSLVNC